MGNASNEIGNRLRELRLRAGLTQRALAERAKTSQQQVARVERGLQRASLDLANRLADALSAPLVDVFPKSKAAAKRMRAMKHEEVALDALNGGELTEQWATADIDLDPRVWLLKMRLSNGTEHLFQVTATEQRRIRNAMFDEAPFVVFDSEDLRILANLRHVEYLHMLFEPPGFQLGSNASNNGSVEPPTGITVYLGSSGAALKFGIDEDQPDDPYEEGGLGQIGHLLYMAEHWDDADDAYRFHFEDNDGEEVFLLPAALSLLTVPLWVVEPAAMDAAMEADEEAETVGTNTEAKYTAKPLGGQMAG